MDQKPKEQETEAAQTQTEEAPSSPTPAKTEAVTATPPPEKEKQDNPEDVTAEFKTEEVKKEVETLPKTAAASEKKATSDTEKFDLKSWIPVFVGLVTLIGMMAYAFRYWLPR